jgi:hypothetical protein
MPEGCIFIYYNPLTLRRERDWIASCSLILTVEQLQQLQLQKWSLRSQAEIRKCCGRRVLPSLLRFGSSRAVTGDLPLGDSSFFVSTFELSLELEYSISD